VINDAVTRGFAAELSDMEKSASFGVLARQFAKGGPKALGAAPKPKAVKLTFGQKANLMAARGRNVGRKAWGHARQFAKNNPGTAIGLAGGAGLGAGYMATR
jgi:hypothetical protein